MKYRRTAKFHGLRRPRIRQSWNKFNLYNLFRYRPPRTMFKTFFQQKWVAKSETRGYHGEHIRESQWTRMFSKKFNSVVSMKPKYLALNDGSEQATGRGSGLDLSDNPRAAEVPSNLYDTRPTPYMQMTFAPLERRLDTAVFRALFASSTRQARQFVVHGAVTVNGKKMRHPGYLLNPGDMFQVNIEKIMLATGLKKRIQYRNANQVAEAEDAEPETQDVANADPEVQIDLGTTKHSKSEAIKNIQERAMQIVEDHEAMTAIENDRARQITDSIKLERMGRYLPQYYNKIFRLIQHHKSIRQLAEDVKSAKGIQHEVTMVPSRIDAVVEHLSNMLQTLTVKPALDTSRRSTKTSETPAQAKEDEAADAGAAAQAKNEADAEAEARAKAVAEAEAEVDGNAILTLMSSEASETLTSLVRRELENPWDPTKPYLTPWRPKPYMSAFAFIPRYLEVNQKIGAAVYLRHPVARPGMAEVPTPFPVEVSRLAFNWYLRRR